jgi:small subunit ribosomal protein S6
LHNNREYDILGSVVSLLVLDEPLVHREEVKGMNKYEALFVVAPNLGDEEVNATVDKVKGVIQNGGGTIDNIDDWGKRRLAYEINDLNEGFYFLVNFSADPQLPKELERILRISDSVMRHIVVKLEK